jgi:hypothetical protein
MKITMTHLLAALLLLAVPAARAADAVDIRVKFRLMGEVDRKFQGPGGGDRKVDKESRVMEVTVTANQPSVAAPVKVEYWAVRKGIQGRLTVAAKGEANLTLALRKPQTVASEPFILTEKRKEGAGERREKHVESEIEEYVVTITDAAGKVIAEKLTSKDAKQVVMEAKPDRRK